MWNGILKCVENWHCRCVVPCVELSDPEAPAPTLERLRETTIKTRQQVQITKKQCTHPWQSVEQWSWQRRPCLWRCKCKIRCGRNCIFIPDERQTCGRRGGRRRGCCCWRRYSAPGGRIMRSQPNARNTMLSVGNTIEAGGREVDLPGCRSEDQMFPRLSSTGSR